MIDNFSIERIVSKQTIITIIIRRKIDLKDEIPRLKNIKQNYTLETCQM